MYKKLGKIASVKFGICGYNDICIGLAFTFSFGACGITNDICINDFNRSEHDENCHWTIEERDKQALHIIRKISDLLSECKVTDVNDLKNMPVELTLENKVLRSWRILTEVI